MLVEQDVEMSSPFLEKYSLGPLGWRYGIPFALLSTSSLATGYVLLGDELGSPFIFFVPVVGMSAYLGGLVPGLVATASSFALGFIVVPDELLATYWTQIVTRSLTCAGEGVLSAFLFHRLQILVTNLRRTNRMADVLRSELNHRVGNFLQNVLSFCYMQRSRGQNGHSLDAIIEKLNALGQVHHLLQTGAETFGSAVVTQVVSAVLDKHKHQVEIGSEIRLHRDQIQPILLILNELVSNTAKHSTSDQLVQVKLHCHQGECELVYCDGGSEAPVVGKGLGMKIVLSLVEQLKGEVVFGATPKARITFPTC